jgi:hypothetical protein
MDDRASRWVITGYTSPSGKILFRCGVCGRVSTTPDKNCNSSWKCGDWSPGPPVGIREPPGATVMNIVVKGSPDGVQTEVLNVSAGDVIIARSDSANDTIAWVDTLHGALSILRRPHDVIIFGVPPGEVLTLERFKIELLKHELTKQTP